MFPSEMIIITLKVNERKIANLDKKRNSRQKILRLAHNSTTTTAKD